MDGGAAGRRAGQAILGQRTLAGEIRGVLRGQAGLEEALDGVGGGQGVEPAVAGGAARGRGKPADQADARQAAVGVGVEADGGDRVVVLASELVAGVGLQPGAGEQRAPGRVAFRRSGIAGRPGQCTSAEALYLKWAVSTTMRRITPGKASRMTTWSWPSSRRRRVSQPSPMVRAWPGRIRWAAEV